METWRYFIRLLVTFLGRWRRPRIYPFKENEVVSTGFEKKIPFLTSADYINLHPTTYLLANSPDGVLQNLKGGFLELRSGRYTYYLVDKRDRSGTLPKIVETTLDGAMVSLVINVQYKVMDPIRVLGIQEPVETLFSTLHSDAKEYIRTHRFDEIVGSNDTTEIDPDRMIRYIRQAQNKHHNISRAFTILDLMIKDREVDSKLMGIRKNLQVQQGEKNVEGKLLTQKQDLERRVTAQEAEIKRIKAEAEVNQQKILKEKQLQVIEIDNARRDWQWRQDKWLRAMDAIEKTLSIPYPRDQREIDVVRDLLNELREFASQGIEVSAEDRKSTVRATNYKSSARIDSLTNTLLSMLDRKKQP